MKRFRISILLACAASLAVAGCQTNPGATEGAGFAKVNLNSAGRQALITLDRPSAEVIAANNRACDRAPACIK